MMRTDWEEWGTVKEMIRFQDARGYYLCMYDLKKQTRSQASK